MELGLLDHGWAAAIALFSLAAAWSGWRQARGRSTLVEPVVMSSSEKWSVYLGSSASLWILGGATLGVWLLGRRPLETLGFGAPEWTWWATGVLAVFVAGLTWDTLRQLSPERIERTRARWRTEAPFMPATPGEVARYSVLASPTWVRSAVSSGPVSRSRSAYRRSSSVRHTLPKARVA